MADAITTLAARMGIAGSYTDVTGRRRRTGRATQQALLRAMGLSAESPGAAAEQLAALEAEAAGRSLPQWHVCRPGVPPAVALPEGLPWQLALEDGGTAEGRGAARLPALPLGLHTLSAAGTHCTLICAPATLPAPPRGWGVGLPLYALRVPDEGGLGDYDDLARAGEALAGHGAQFVGLNPLHAGFLADPGSFSPYTPSHRRRLNALHLPLGMQASAGRALIDYRAELPRLRAGMEAAHARFLSHGGEPDFEAFRRAEGPSLATFALHQALSDRLGAYWDHWPAAYRDPASAQVTAAARELAEAVTFHAWLQWQAHRALGTAQARLRAAGMRHGLYLDLAVGTHPFGAETWEDRESFAFGASLGAPPDAFSADGQSWGLAPFNPAALVRGGFRALAETLRCQLDRAGMLRIDHILGFERAFWVPQEAGLPGSYVAMPREAMLAVLRLEAARAGAVIVGEDLGNIPAGLRARMARSGVLGCRVQMFERTDWAVPAFRAPAQYDRAALASFSTHDLPTWPGWRAGRDIAARAGVGGLDAATARAEQAHRAREVSAFDAMAAGAAPAGSTAAMHHALGASASQLVLVQIENVLEMADQQNLPGTVEEYPNWRRRLPLPVADYADDPRFVAAAAIMAQHRR